MAAGLVAVALGAQGAEGTEELWTWATGAAPSGSQTHRSKPTNRSNRAATFKHSEYHSKNQQCPPSKFCQSAFGRTQPWFLIIAVNG